MSVRPDLRVIVVEDQAILAMELEMILGDAGCDVLGCTMDAAATLALVEQQTPDLAFVDVNLLDGMTGPEIAHRLVRDHGTTVIFLTANPEQIPEGFAGALGAVTKPFDEHTILAVIEFARMFIHHRQIGPAPSRFRLAPWLRTPPDHIAPH